MTESAVEIRASGNTGAACRQAGPYRSSRNARIVVFLRPGDRFPADGDGAQTTWVLVSEDD
jgi:hypothetical protein